MHTLSFCLIFLFIFSCSQELEETLNLNGQLSGHIYSQQGGTLKGALVKLTSPHHSQEVETNAFGRFTIKGIPSGDYTAHISHEDYVGTSNLLTVGGGIITQQDFNLEKGQSKLSVSAMAVNATVVKGAFVLQIFSNSNWTMETSAHWISLSEQEGKENKDVKIIWEENTSSEERYADVIISAGGINHYRKHSSILSQ